MISKNEVVTETYLVVATFDTQEEAENCSAYLKLKFPRFLLRLTYSSMNVNRANFIFVPTQDFSESWSDEKLYKKYHLSQEEIDYIESLIKPLE